MGMAKVTRNYQITLPKDARKLFNIKVGDMLLVSAHEEKEGVFIRKISTNVVDDTFGSWGKGKDAVKYIREMRDEYGKTRAKRLGI